MKESKTRMWSEWGVVDWMIVAIVGLVAILTLLGFGARFVDALSGGDPGDDPDIGRTMPK